jgi:hypothetical protein
LGSTLQFSVSRLQSASRERAQLRIGNNFGCDGCPHVQGCRQKKPQSVLVHREGAFRERVDCGRAGPIAFG